MSKIYVLGFFLLLISSGASAQRFLSGTIRGNAELLVSATILNISQNKINISDLGGNYKIGAEVGEIIIFSHEGFISDTMVVDSSMFSERLPVDLQIQIAVLKTVDVNEMSRYSLDSLARREDYDYIFKNKNNKKLWDNKLSGDGSGVNFSPLGHWSSEEKQKKRLKERLEMDDKEEFIYLKFSRRVPRLTGLGGDSLIIFVNRYKPSYDFCLHATSVDMLIYINDKFILFKKKKDK